MKALAPCVLALLSTGCAVGPDFERPAAPAVSGYISPTDAPAPASVAMVPSAQTPRKWWNAFGSDALGALVGEAFANNQTLAAAEARLESARAEAAEARSSAAPQVDANSGAERQRINTQAFGITGFPSPTLSLYSLGAAVSFDLDLFGGQRRTIEREDAYAAASQARVDAAYLTLSGNVVQQAVRIAGLRAQIDAQEQVLAADARIQDMIERAIRAGGQPRSALDTVNAQLAEDQAALPPLRQRLAEYEHRLALYLGRAPADAPAFTLDLGSLQAPQSVPLALPSELVRRRPDILAAEADVHAATADIGVATAALYPAVSLNASWTQLSISPEDIFESTSASWAAGPSVTAPIFHGGALRAGVHRANAAQREALANYQQTVLEAFVQVADVLASINNSADLVEANDRATAAANANARTAAIAYDAGAGTLLSLVDAQRQANRASLAAIDARVALLNAYAALYVASAADWTEAP